MRANICIAHVHTYRAISARLVARAIRVVSRVYSPLELYSGLWKQKEGLAEFCGSTLLDFISRFLRMMELELNFEFNRHGKIRGQMNLGSWSTREEG